MSEVVISRSQSSQKRRVTRHSEPELLLQVLTASSQLEDHSCIEAYLNSSVMLILEFHLMYTVYISVK